MIHAKAKGTEIAEVNIQWRLLPRIGILVEKVGNSKLNRITCRTINGGGEKSRKRRDRKLRYIVILTESIKEGVLELG